MRNCCVTSRDPFYFYPNNYQKAREGCGCPKFLAGKVFRQVSTLLEISSPIFRQHEMLSLPRFGHFPARKWLLENRPRLQECSWIFSSETATAFLSFFWNYLSPLDMFRFTLLNASSAVTLTACHEPSRLAQHCLRKEAGSPLNFKWRGFSLAKHWRKFKGQHDWGQLKTSEESLKPSENLWRTLPLRDPLRGRFPSQRLSVLLPLCICPLNSLRKQSGFRKGWFPKGWFWWMSSWKTGTRVHSDVPVPKTGTRVHLDVPGTMNQNKGR